MSVANQYEVQMLALINAERAANGLQPLRLNAKLNSSAELHSRWMLQTDIFSHTGANGSSAGDRMIAAGYVFSGNWANGENIAWQSERGAAGISDDVINLHQSLMNSPGHRANILNPNFVEIGIGIEEGLFTTGGTNWPAVIVTQNFARSSADNGGADDGTPPPPPPPIAGVTELADTVNGTVNGELIDALGGNDRISGLGGNDTLRGGLGDDTIFGGDGLDRLEGGVGNDSLLGDAGNDVILGGDGLDRLYGGLGNDSLEGDGGNDRLFGGDGLDTIGGGIGRDYLAGDAGNDRLFGGAGNDSLNGGTGDDRLEGGADRDILVGALGNDVLIGDAGDDSQTGNEGNDYLRGGDGNDTLDGGADTDNLIGDGGNDHLLAGAGNDSVWGNDGNDWLEGGTGIDGLVGGAGSDNFVFRPSTGADRVYDFTDNVDTLVFAGGLWNGSMSVQTFVSTYGRISGSSAIFDFGGGNVVTVNGVTNLSTLYDDISFLA